MTAAGSRKWWKGEPGYDERETFVLEWQWEDVAQAPLEIGEALFVLKEACAVQHRRRDVDASDMARDVREGAREDARTAGNIKHTVIGPRARKPGHEFEGGFIANGW